MRKLFKGSRPSILSSKIGESLHKMQLRCARWMQKREAKWSMAQKRVYLGVFLLFSCAACVSVLLSGINHQPKLSKSSIVIIPLRVPTIQQSPMPHFKLNADDTVRVLTFLHLVDSLELSEEGRKQLQKYFEARPGMRDSIPILKEIFKK